MVTGIAIVPLLFLSALLPAWSLRRPAAQSTDAEPARPPEGSVLRVHRARSEHSPGEEADVMWVDPSITNVVEDTMDMSDRAKEAAEAVCEKYQSNRGALAECMSCAKLMPFQEDACMECGWACRKQVCKGKAPLACHSTSAFKGCHSKCASKRPDPTFEDDQLPFAPLQAPIPPQMDQNYYGDPRRVSVAIMLVGRSLDNTEPPRTKISERRLSEWGDSVPTKSRPSQARVSPEAAGAVGPSTSSAAGLAPTSAVNSSEEAASSSANASSANSSSANSTAMSARREEEEEEDSDFWGERISMSPWWEPWYVPPDVEGLTARVNNSGIAEKLKVSNKEMATLMGTDYWAWQSFLQYVYRPMTELLGHPPDVYLCNSNITGPRPPELTDAFDIQAKEQFTRAHECYQRVVAKQEYTIYVKSRPDFVFTGPFPNVLAMNPRHLHSRFREVLNIHDLNSAHVSWDVCMPRCKDKLGAGRTVKETREWLEQAEEFGYVNDDMVFVAPQRVADRVFLDEKEAMPLRRGYTYPPGWFNPVATNWETLFTQGLLAQGVATVPMEIRGYPKNAKVSHKQHHKECLWKRIPKTMCGAKRRPMMDVLQVLSDDFRSKHARIR